MPERHQHDFEGQPREKRVFEWEFEDRSGKSLRQGCQCKTCRMFKMDPPEVFRELIEEEV